jgi:hypothetical protein
VKSAVKSDLRFGEITSLPRTAGVGTGGTAGITLEENGWGEGGN